MTMVVFLAGLGVCVYLAKINVYLSALSLVVSWLVANQVSGEHTVFLLLPISKAIGHRIKKGLGLPIEADNETEDNKEEEEEE